jgi:fructuronate reductase
MRAVPVLQAERAAGRSGAAAALMIAAWMDYSAASAFQDPLADEVAAANRLRGAERIRTLLALVDPALAGDGAVVDLIKGLSGTFGEQAVSP